MVHEIWQPYPAIALQLERVKQKMLTSVNIPMKDIEQKIHDYINAPGKYIRSGLALIVATEFNQELDERFIHAGASLELLHLATLIHDDVIDNADFRRGIDAIHTQYSNRIAIYAGDYLLSLSGRLMAESKFEVEHNIVDDKLLEYILIGELRQLMNQQRESMTMVDYLRQIKGKTAVLFGMATMTGGLNTGLSRRQLKRLFYAGQMIGMAFQLNDDLIDYRQQEQESGKPFLQDIQNGIYTAPYLLLKQAHQQPLPEDETEILYLMDKYNIFAQVETMINQYLRKSYRYFESLGVDTTMMKTLLDVLHY
ncbi:polyprenyl synthetase family protein [Tuanshanicoccus lijuaniae]|uniref:polyprenyl synthetase family protein n=1 Tax=Aerococcaceae bacterium zg-1292 TaxID=2774330 RepID=UPI001BD83D85|nr:polyprenyl synthetase family protein [Aerococcaceae bacterium zg-A91]MBS4457195.1 polyprenyl synthetase family protein [Aerococcaceae bacterium zg-BR33]